MREDWQNQVRRQASSHGMCEENRTALSNVGTKSEAIALYKKTIDWALERGYPDIGTIRQYFSDCEADGVFVDKVFHGEVLNGQQVYVFHNCSGTIRTGLNVEKKIIPMLYFANGCTMRVAGIDGHGLKARVPLYIFGENSISAEQSEDIMCKTFNFDAK